MVCQNTLTCQISKRFEKYFSSYGHFVKFLLWISLRKEQNFIIYCFDRIQLMAKNDGIEACQLFSKNIFRNFLMGIHAKIQKNGHISKTKPTIILKFCPELHYSVTNRW